MALEKRYGTSPAILRQAGEAVECALQDIGGRHPVYHLGSPSPGYVVGDERSRDGGGREALVPIGDGEIGARRKIAGEGARRLSPRAHSALQIERQTKNDARDVKFGEDRYQSVGILLEGAARERSEGRGDPAFDVGDRKSDRLGSQVDADQAALGRKPRSKIFESNRRGHPKRLSRHAGRVERPGPGALSRRVCAQNERDV